MVFHHEQLLHLLYSEFSITNIVLKIQFWPIKSLILYGPKVITGTCVTHPLSHTYIWWHKIYFHMEFWSVALASGSAMRYYKNSSWTNLFYKTGRHKNIVYNMTSYNANMTAIRTFSHLPQHVFTGRFHNLLLFSLKSIHHHLG